MGDKPVIMDQDDELARLKAMRADILNINADLDGVVRALTAAQIENKILKAQIQALRRALEHFTHCEFTDENCANLEIASRRIRTMARAALNQSSGD